MTKNNNHNLGRSGEGLVADHYAQQGYKIIAKNFQYYNKGSQGRLGEIDLIVQSDNTICFVEVKSRNDLSFGHPAEQIDYKKLRHLFKTYQYFMLNHPQYQSLYTRFDAAEVLKGKINVIYNAYNFDQFWD
jgi:putative endonuclease